MKNRIGAFALLAFLFGLCVALLVEFQITDTNGPVDHGRWITVRRENEETIAFSVAGIQTNCPVGTFRTSRALLSSVVSAYEVYLPRAPLDAIAAAARETRALIGSLTSLFPERKTLPPTPGATETSAGSILFGCLIE